jgi:hypothetical protein
VVPDAANPSQATYTHNGSSRASDQVTVTVVDSKNATAQGSVTLSLQANRGPEVQIAGGGASCHPPCTLPLTASATDPEGDALAYAWFGCASGSTRTAECSVRHPGTVEAALVVLDGRGGMATTAVTVTGTNRAPTVEAPNGTEFSGGRARFTVLYDDPDGDDPVCGWIGFCQCTGSVQSYNLDCVLPEGLSSCRQTMTCTDAFGARTERTFNLRR